MSLKNLPQPLLEKTCWPWTQEASPLPSLMRDGKPWPKISIVTPSYNQGQFIEETIRTVLLQGYPNLEYIIIDGGSTDNSVEIIKKYEPWLAYWVSEPDKGQAHALNKGFAKATGCIYAYLNSDDLYTAGCFHRIAKDFIQDNVPSWHAYPVQEFSEDGLLTLYFAPVISEKLRPIKQDAYALDLIMKKNPINWDSLLTWVLGKVQLHQPGVFWSSEFYREVGGFDERFHYGFDRKFFMHLIANNHPVKVHQGEPCAYFRIHDNSKSVKSSEDEENNPFSSEALVISRSFESSLTLRNRLVAQSARAENVISDIWKSYHQQQIGSVHCLKRLFALAAESPGVLGSRFYWGTIKRMLIGNYKIT